MASNILVSDSLALLQAKSALKREIPGFVREMGVDEQMALLAQEQRWLLLSNALLLVSKEEVGETLLRDALKELMRIVPCLRLAACTHRHDGTPLERPVFVEPEHPKLCLETIPSGDWKDVLSAEWCKSYDVINGPLWRVKFLPNAQIDKKDVTFPYECVVIFSFFHGIIDGMGYQRLFGYFLDCLEVVKSSKPDQAVELKPLKLFPSLDHYLNASCGYMESVMSGVLRLATSTYSGRRVVAWLSRVGKTHHYLSSGPLPIEANQDTPRVTAIIPLEISRDLTTAVIQAAKVKEVTVHAILSTVAVIAYAKMLQGGKIQTDFTTNSYCPINLRFLSDELSLDSIGFFVSLLKLKYEIPQNIDDRATFWNVVSGVREQIKENISNKGYMRTFYMVRILLSAMAGTKTDFTDIAAHKYGRDETELVVTNMGRCDFLDRTDKDSFKLVGRYGGACDHQIGAIIGNNINTFNGHINWSLVFSRHIIHQQKVELYAEYLKEVLQYYCGNVKC